MRLGILGLILWERARLRPHERWSRQRLQHHQARSLRDLRDHALTRSGFYRELHRGLEKAPLQELPPVTKATLMGRFDEVVTDPAVRLADLERFVEGLKADDLFHGKYWVSATSGSSGIKSIIPSDAREWARIVASYGRANEWSGVRISPFAKHRMGIVSSRSPFHQSARVGQTVNSSFLPTLRLDAARPLPETTAALDEFQPEILVAYASMIRLLAEEQVAGRLHIHPDVVNSSSEVLTSDARATVREAWGRQPFEVYAATETGGIAAECDRHEGMHLFEDLVIAEPVDDQYRPVEPGTTGARLLVTVLFSRTLPLVRYELTDRVRVSKRTCSCGRPFRLIESIEGRTEDALELPAEGGGKVRVHPVVFHQALELQPVEAWQVRKQGERLKVLLLAPKPGTTKESVAEAVRSGLSKAGVAGVEIVVEVVDAIPAGAGGKRPLVIAE